MSNDVKPYQKALRTRFGDNPDRDSAEVKAFEAGWDAAFDALARELPMIALEATAKAVAASAPQMTRARAPRRSKGWMDRINDALFGPF